MEGHLHFVSKAPEHGPKCEAHSQSQQEAGPVVLRHAPVGSCVLGKDSPELRHHGLGIAAVEFELLAALHW